MIEYVCGFAFSEDKQNVLLIEKDRPEWQAGKLNGVGGKIDEKDHLGFFPESMIPIPNAEISAMVREFKEEVGIDTLPEDWELFAISEDINHRIYNFRMFSDNVNNYRQMESEVPKLIPARHVWICEAVPNLSFLVNMALDTEEVFEIQCKIRGGNDVIK